MRDFYAPIGSQVMLMAYRPITRPLLANLFRGLTALLFLLLVPLMYVVIFRARKKHVMAVGEWEHTEFVLPIVHQESQKGRKLGGRRPTPLGPRYTLVLGSWT